VCSIPRMRLGLEVELCFSARLHKMLIDSREKSAG
jgi:hypothetical protein